MTLFIIWSLVFLLLGFIIGYSLATHLDSGLIERLREECNFWQEQRHQWKAEALSRANVKYDD